MAPPDPIRGVSEAFRTDPSDVKLNLGVGAYRTEELHPYVLNVVQKAEKLMLEKGDNKEYLPIEGLAAFNKVTAELMFGADNPVINQERVATIQGLYGTGSLRLAAAFIERYFPDAKVLISSPSWGNHKNIFNDARVPWSGYWYYDPKTIGLDFEGMLLGIKEMYIRRYLQRSEKISISSRLKRGRLTLRKSSSICKQLSIQKENDYIFTNKFLSMLLLTMFDYIGSLMVVYMTSIIHVTMVL